MSKICRHCHKGKVCRPRGLCWACFYTPGVRDQYPSTSKYAHRGVGNLTGKTPLPEAPTHTEPGSEERIQVLAQRAARGESLFHRDDVQRVSEGQAPWVVPTVTTGLPNDVLSSLLGDDDEM